MKLKPGASLDRVNWRMFAASIAIEPVFNKRGAHLVITSGSDGEHMKGSLHEEGLALDYRTRDIRESERKNVAAECQEILGGDFDVVLEDDHMHIEYDPEL